jgi:uncharacterized damage-inducible protein DinB
MSFDLSLEHLLSYTDWDRTQWHKWFREHGPATLAVELGPNNAGRIRNVGELVRHIFSAEKRYVERCRQMPLSDTASVPANDVEALFAFGVESRAALRELLETFPDTEWDAPREMSFGTHSRTVTSRKMILQAITHEMRHWAQVASFLRHAGYHAGVHDFIASPLFDLPAVASEPAPAT